MNKQPEFTVMKRFEWISLQELPIHQLNISIDGAYIHADITLGLEDVQELHTFLTHWLLKQSK